MPHSVTEVSIPSTESQATASELLQRYWQRLAYHHRLAEACLYLLFATGLPLWSLFSLPWIAERTLLLTHILAGLVLFPLAVLPFWFSHRRLLKAAIKKPVNGNASDIRRKHKLRKTGRAIDLLLLLSTLSGVYLLLLGNRGESLGLLSHYVHLITAIPIALLLIIHALRWSILKPVINLVRALFRC